MQASLLRSSKKEVAGFPATSSFPSAARERSRLEREPRDDLQRARRRDAADRPEAILLGQIPVRVVGQVRNPRVCQAGEVRGGVYTRELRMVQRIEDVDAEFELGPAVHRHFLRYRQVEVV